MNDHCLFFKLRFLFKRHRYFSIPLLGSCCQRGVTQHHHHQHHIFTHRVETNQQPGRQKKRKPQENKLNSNTGRKPRRNLFTVQLDKPKEAQQEEKRREEGAHSKVGVFALVCCCPLLENEYVT